MSAVEEYRQWCHESEKNPDGNQYNLVHVVPRHLADAALAALETENEDLRARRLPCAGGEVAQARYEQAEAALAERDRMLEKAMTALRYGESEDLPARAAWLERELQKAIDLHIEATNRELVAAEIMSDCLLRTPGRADKGLWLRMSQWLADLRACAEVSTNCQSESELTVAHAGEGKP